MKCKKCGYELKENWIVCPKCSELVVNNDENIQQTDLIKIVQNQELPKSDGKERIYLIIFLICILLGSIIEQLRTICFFMSLTTIVAGFIKYPNSRAIKVLFWLFLTGIVICIIYITLIIFACTKAISSCYNS